MLGQTLVDFSRVSLGRDRCSSRPRVLGAMYVRGSSSTECIRSSSRSYFL